MQKLEVGLGVNTKDFTAGLNTAKQSFAQFQNALGASPGVKQASVALRQLQESLAGVKVGSADALKEIQRMGTEARQQYTALARAAYDASKAQQEAGKGSKGFFDELVGGFQKTAMHGLAFGGAAAIGAKAASGLIDMIKMLPEEVLAVSEAFISYSEAVEKLSVRSGVATAETEKLMNASKVLGVNATSVATAIQRMDAIIGSGKQDALIKSLGLDKAELMAQGPLERMREILEATEKIGDAGERAYTQRTLLSRSYIEVIEAERKGLFTLMDQQYALGDAAVESGAAAGRAIKQMGVDYEMLKVKIGSLLIESGALNAVIYAGIGVVGMAGMAFGKFGLVMLDVVALFQKAAAAASFAAEVIAKPWNFTALSTAFKDEVKRIDASLAYAKTQQKQWRDDTVNGALDYGRRLKTIMELTPKAGGGETDMPDRPDKEAAKREKAWEKSGDKLLASWKKIWQDILDVQTKAQREIESMLGPAWHVGMQQGLPKESEKSFGAGERPVAAGTYGGDGSGFFPLKKMAEDAALGGTALDDIKRKLEATSLPAAKIEEIMDGVRQRVKEAGASMFNWQGLLQGAAMMAGTVGGKFGESIQAAETLGQSFSQFEIGKKDAQGNPIGKWSTMSKKEKINAGLGLAGQGISMIGGLMQNEKGTNATAGAIQGAGSGMAMGASFGPVGAGIGAAVGGLMGFLSAKKKKKAEEQAKKDEEKKQLEEITKSIETQYGSMLKARNAAALYGVNLKNAMDTKNPKALENALKDLEKRQKGMQTAMAGAAGLVSTTKKGTEGLVGIKDATPEVAAAKGALFGSVFWAAVKTEGLAGAAASLGEPFDAMWESASESMRTMLAPIRQQLDLARNESFAAAADGANALTQVLSGLADAGVISIADLGNASIIATDQYNQALAAAQEQGLAPAAAQEAAIRAVGPAVAELIAQYDALGIPLDENLQKLKDAAAASGIMFPEEPMVRAAEAMERVAAALEKSFGLSTGLADNVDRIGRGRIPGSSDTGNTNVDASFAKGTRGPVVVQRDMIAQVHAGEGLMVIPKNEMPTGGMGFGSFRRGTEEGEDPPEGRRGGGGGSSDSPSESSSAASVVDALVEQVKALAEAVADRGTPISIDNPVSVQIVDQSAVKTVEGQRAFGKFVVAEVERALDQNSRGLTTKIEDIARRAAR